MAESRKAAKDNESLVNKSAQRDVLDSTDSRLTEEAGRADSIPECAVCLQICVHPARLPCSHIFCFLCLKGLVTQSRRCAMCRQDIPPDYLDHPQLLEVPTAVEKEAFEDGYQWFYEGRSGWWQYDERTSRELEAAYKSGHRTCDLLIVGQLYTADFDAMLQYRRNDVSRRRRIKRDLASIPKKGIAGLRLEGAQNSDTGDDLPSPTSSSPSVPARFDADRSSTVRNLSESPGSQQGDNLWRVQESHETDSGSDDDNDDDDDLYTQHHSEDQAYECDDEDENGQEDSRIQVAQFQNLWLG